MSLRSQNVPETRPLREDHLDSRLSSQTEGDMVQVTECAVFVGYKACLISVNVVFALSTLVRASLIHNSRRLLFYPSFFTPFLFRTFLSFFTFFAFSLLLLFAFSLLLFSLLFTFALWYLWVSILFYLLLCSILALCHRQASRFC